MLALGNMYGLGMQIKSTQAIQSNITQDVYHSPTIPATAYVVKIPLDAVDIALVPAIGQREGTCSIAKRTNANIAINGSNYRRGGNYNGNHVNLFYLNHIQFSGNIKTVRSLCLER